MCFLTLQKILARIWIVYIYFKIVDLDLHKTDTDSQSWYRVE